MEEKGGGTTVPKREESGENEKRGREGRCERRAAEKDREMGKGVWLDMVYPRLEEGRREGGRRRGNERAGFETLKVNTKIYATEGNKLKRSQQDFGATSVWP